MKSKCKNLSFLVGSYFMLHISLLVTSSFVSAQEPPQFPPQNNPFEAPLDPDEVVPPRFDSQPESKDNLSDKSDKLKPFLQKKAELDQLFTTLKRTADAKQAETVSRQIQEVWSQSGSATIDLLMEWAEDAARNEQYTQAMDFLDNVVALDPTYAEGWMRRASIHIQMNDIILAALELNMVLQYEPRQFNAMVQLGGIFEITDHPLMALDMYNKALDIYPQMIKLQKRVIDLLEKNTDRAI